jgi:hypothetical protein
MAVRFIHDHHAMSDILAPDAPIAAAPAPDRTAAPAARTFDVDCTLAYQVNGPTDFLFQIHALDGLDQRVLDESLVITPPLPHHVYCDPTVGHRFLRLHADGGPVELRYRASVERRPIAVDPQAREMPIAELPDDLLHNLNPTRYCESDLLGRAAQMQFGDHTKLSGARWIVQRLLGRDIEAERADWVYVGDSTNDQLMFGHFPLSVGVANLMEFAAQLTTWPAYLTDRARGAGFAEVARRLISAR